MQTIEVRVRCPQCEREGTITGKLYARNPAELDAIEQAVSGKTFVCRCDTCDVVCDVAMFVDDQQTEPWTNADEYERQFGKPAGPLPPKPWPDTN